MIYEVDAEGTQFKLYLDNIDLSFLPDRMKRFELTQKLLCEWNARVVSYSSIFAATKENFYFLVWQDSPNLAQLDLRVKSNTYTDSDFEFAFRCNATKLTCLFGCEAEFNAFVFDAVESYPNSQDLQDVKRDRLLIARCPICNSNFGPHVVSVLNQTGAPKR